LAFAADGDSRIDLADRITAATQEQHPVHTTTPLGFFQDEVILFWPLLIQELNLKAQFPLRLRPENEQELATQLWRPELDQGRFQCPGISEYRLVRRTLDLLLLAASSGTPAEDIPSSLEQGLTEQEGSSELWACMGELLIRWRTWCLERGLLTYGIVSELYWRYLLPNPTYQRHLIQRYQAVLADDVDDYPAIARHLFDCLLDQGLVGAFTYNPDGAPRLGLRADPGYLAGLAERCQVEVLSQHPVPCLADNLDASVAEWVSDPLFFSSLPDSIQSIQTTSRSQLLRQTAEVIIEAVQSGQVQPQEVAVIGPGLDAIARYTLIEILNRQGIAVESLNDQRPLVSSPSVRALLTLLALVYPGLGRLIDRNAIAEMLVVLSQQPGANSEVLIDPVRAGLLADYCYSPDPDHPHLLPVTSFPRWDRLGYQATSVYEAILQWLEAQKLQQEQRLIPSAVSILDRAIQRFLWNGSYLPYDQLSTLRELIETAQSYWEVDARLRQSQPTSSAPSMTVGQFIQLLRGGTVTANPYPIRPLGPTNQSVTLATILQYRASRRDHRWHFWLDAGSPLWLSGGAPLFGAFLFVKDWLGQPWTVEAAMQADEQRLRRALLDLLGRVGEQIFLCHSDLAANGQEQTGPLLPLVDASVPFGTGALAQTL
jgi:hypothetical protein